MKNHNINFFQSPCPNHFHCIFPQNVVNHLNQFRYQHSQDHSIHQDDLFVSPTRTNPNPQTQPSKLYDCFGSPKPRAQFPEDMLVESQKSNQNQVENALLQQHICFQGIQEQIQFSQFNQQEQLLVPLTPLKMQRAKPQDQDQNQTTVKRHSSLSTVQLTPGNESKSVQRGLKKLAADAYKFVLLQKRTSYKQVAKRLIGQISQDGDIDVGKRGEMNIKRRVYDALNVLIALGLLRRNGNKILSKREEPQVGLEDSTNLRQRQRRRQLAKQEELAALRQAFQHKEKLIVEKRKLEQRLRQKTELVKKLTNKNKALKAQKQVIENKIQFPLLIVSYEQISKVRNQLKRDYRAKKGSKMAEYNEQDGLRLWQNDPEHLVCSIQSNTIQSQSSYLLYLEQQKDLGVWVARYSKLLETLRVRKECKDNKNQTKEMIRQQQCIYRIIQCYSYINQQLPQQMSLN